MTKMTRIEAVWAEERRNAGARPLDASGLRLTRIDSTSRFDVYGGIDDNDHVVMATGTTFRPPAVVMQSTSLDYFRRQRADGSWLMILRLKTAGLETVFGRLCQDLADAALAVPSEDELVALLVGRLRSWEKLFMRADDGLLRPHEIRGLIAELLMLERILSAGVRGNIPAVDGWTGPSGTERDFKYSDLSIEVKAMSPGRERVTISSLEQLDTSDPLTLVVVTLEASAQGRQGAFSLNSLVARIEGSVAGDPAALSCLKERLLDACYVEQPRYDEDWFHEARVRAYAVRAGFPRLVRDTVPTGVLSASYEIDLTIAAPFAQEKLPS
jgi:hypothetical protein